MERIFAKNPEYFKRYKELIREYQELNHIEQIKEFEEQHIKNTEVHYIPHNAVLKGSRSTTKLRVVFGASL